MSDSYVLGRTRAETKRKPPPKKPRRAPICPIWVGIVILAYAGANYATASRDLNVAEMILDAIIALIYLDDLWLRWQWRQWTKWTGQPRPPLDFHNQLFRGMCIANGGFLLAKAAAHFLALL